VDLLYTDSLEYGNHLRNLKLNRVKKMSVVRCWIANKIPWYFPFGDTLSRLLHKFKPIQQNKFITIYECCLCGQKDATWDYHRIVN